MGNNFSKTPEELQTQITAANSAISNGDWDQEKELYTADLEQPFEQRAAAGEININAADYSMSRLLSPPVNRNTKKREDPEIYAATDLRVNALTGPVAYVLPEGAVDPTEADEPAIQKVEEENLVQRVPSETTMIHSQAAASRVWMVAATWPACPAWVAWAEKWVA